MRKLAWSEVGRGLRWAIGGGLVSGVTYALASGSTDGVYIVAWGAVLYGAILLLRGGLRVLSGR